MALNFPANPTPGQVFSAEGMTFVWNGTLWRTVPPSIPFATTAEARAGVRNDVIMSPALVQARSGVQSLATANITTVIFDQVPAAATEFVIGFFDLEMPANVSFDFGFAGDAAARVWANRTWLVSGSAIGSVNVNGGTVFPVGHETGIANYLGDIIAVYNGSTLWSLHSQLRDGYGTRQQQTVGSFVVTDGVTRFPRLTFSAAPTRGSAFCRWRI